jgi:hypothetical protein
VDTAFRSPSKARQAELESAAAEFSCLQEQRQRLYALIGDYKRALSHPDGAGEAVGILRAILPRTEVYFSLVESMLDRLAPDGAERQREQHCRILLELGATIERCTRCPARAAMVELSHALDGFVIGEVMIRLRSNRAR